MPTHVGYIVDGNRRWAEQHGVPKYEGHLAGYYAVKDVVIASIEAGINFVSIYLFSTENWKRDKDEVNYLLKLVHRLMTQDIKELTERGVRVRFLGTEEGLPEQIVTDMRHTEEISQNLTNGTALICFNYGGHREIVDATRAIVRAGLKPDEINEEVFAKYLYGPDVPPVDVVVRTSGEHRLSNFMLWRAAYSEFIFLDKLWPDMRQDDVYEIIKIYNTRQRRFGI